MIKLCAGAGRSVLFGGKVLADVTISAPLRKHQFCHLLAHSFPRSSNYWDVIILLEAPVRELHHRPLLRNDNQLAAVNEDQT